MYLLKILVSLISIMFILSGCGNKNINMDKENIMIQSSNANKSISNSNNNRLSTNDIKSIVLKKKLYKCNINYIPWKDRLENDLILQPKVLEICDKISFYTEGYILHSTKDKKVGFIVGNNIFIPWLWSKEKIYYYLKSIQWKTNSNKNKVVKRKKVVKDSNYKNSNSVVKIYNIQNRVEIGSPYPLFKK